MRSVSLARRAAPLVGALALHALGALWVHRLTRATGLDGQHGPATAELMIELLPSDTPSAALDQPAAAKLDGTGDTARPQALTSEAHAPVRAGGQRVPGQSAEMTAPAASADVGAQGELAATGAEAAVDP